MNHTKKMILVPHEMSQQTQPVDAVINDLDFEMQRVLHNNQVPTDLKLKQYNQILQRYSSLLEKRNRPYEVSIMEKRNLSVEDSQILEGIPRKQQKYAKLFLYHVRNNPNIIIEPNGEVTIHGNRIPGSNIIDLVHDFSRDRKTRTPVIGAIEFAKVLKQANIPMESIGNKNRGKLFEDEVFTPIRRIRPQNIVMRNRLDWTES